MSIIAIPKILSDRLTEEGAKAFVEIIEKVEDSAQKAALQMSEDRFERRLTEEIGKLRIEIHALRADIIRWMFIFWIGQFASIVGVLSAILFAFFRR